MRIATWILQATNTHSEFVKRIAFPLQQWLHERASKLRYTYIDCIVPVEPAFHFPYLFTFTMMMEAVYLPET